MNSILSSWMAISHSWLWLCGLNYRKKQNHLLFDLLKQKKLKKKLIVWFIIWIKNKKRKEKKIQEDTNYIFKKREKSIKTVKSFYTYSGSWSWYEKFLSSKCKSQTTTFEDPSLFKYFMVWTLSTSESLVVNTLTCRK